MLTCYYRHPQNQLEGSIQRNTGKQLTMLKISEANAIKQLSELSELIRKKEDDLKLQNIQIREKMQEKIDIMRKQLTENKSLWQQLAEAEKRENILKQEMSLLNNVLQSQRKQMKCLKKNLRRLKPRDSDSVNIKLTKQPDFKIWKEKLDRLKCWSRLILISCSKC